MLFRYNSCFALFSITAIISASVALAAWRRRSISYASKPFILMMLAIAGYATVAALEAAATTLPDKIFWSKLEYICSSSVITLFLIFAMHFTHQKRWLTPQNITLLWVIPAFNIALVQTNELHHLVWTGFLIAPNNSNVVIYQHGVGFIWVMAWVYVYVLTAIVLLVKTALSPSVLYRQQSILLLAGAVIPLVGGTAYMLKLAPPGLNITPMSFMLTGLIVFVGLFRLRMLELVPVARDTLIECMSDGVLVLDTRNRIVDINPAAEQILETKGSCIGKSADTVLSKWQHIIGCHDDEFKTELLTDLATYGYVELRMMRLRDRRQRLTGYLVVLRDITQHHKASVELRQANERLQNQLIEIQRLHGKLREQAIRDGLTGLFNRRYFEEAFSRELTIATREGYSVALLLMDIDYFKKINDTFGHQGGDRVLQAFGILLLGHIRSRDIACRYGGEEFVLALPGMSLKSAYDRAEQIRFSFQQARVKFGDKEIHATFSGGLGIFPNHGKTSDELLQKVDRALYAAKADGRNCIKLVS